MKKTKGISLVLVPLIATSLISCSPEKKSGSTGDWKASDTTRVRNSAHGSSYPWWYFWRGSGSSFAPSSGVSGISSGTTTGKAGVSAVSRGGFGSIGAGHGAGS